MRKTFGATCLVAATLALGGCATHIKPSVGQNPPPKEKFANFQQFELRPVQVAPEFAQDSANQRAVNKIQENLSLNLTEKLNSWSMAKGAGRKLIIEPYVDEIKFVSSAMRVFTGPLSGSSAVRMHVKFTDAATGQEIANPEFYQRSSAGGGFALGVLDNLMMTRTAKIASDYIINNYTAAIGGPSGGEMLLDNPSTTESAR